MDIELSGHLEVQGHNGDSMSRSNVLSIDVEKKVEGRKVNRIEVYS